MYFKKSINSFWVLFRSALKGDEKDYVSGNLNRAIFLLSVPMILEMVMESLFAVADVFFVAQVSVDAVATVGLTEAVGGRSIIRIGWDNLKLKRDVLWRLFKIAIGGVSQYLIGSASWIFLARIINIFGSEIFAGYTIAFRIIMFTILPSWGLALAAATLVGQNLGASQPQRAEDSVWRCARFNMVFLLLVSLVFGYFAPDIVALFSDFTEVVRFGALSLRYICFGYVFFAYGMVINQAFNGAGDTRTPTIISAIAYWLFQIPFAYSAAVIWDWGPQGVFITVAISISLYALISIVVFRQGRWKTVQI